jgi:hypothetical protein
VSDPYREPGMIATGAEIKCPRCAGWMQATDVAECGAGCGTWVSELAASEVLRHGEQVVNMIAKLTHPPAGCPICRVQMLPRGDTKHPFHGCTQHGFWIDADTIRYTGLEHGFDPLRLARKRDRLAESEVEAREVEELRELAPPRPPLPSPPLPPPPLRSPSPLDAADELLESLEPRTLLDRIERLELRNRALEQRIVQLEQLVRRRGD